MTNEEKIEKYKAEGVEYLTSYNSNGSIAFVCRADDPRIQTFDKKYQAILALWWIKLKRLFGGR